MKNAGAASTAPAGERSRQGVGIYSNYTPASQQENAMKYLIKQRVINGDQIRQVQYMPEDKEVKEQSACFIDSGGRDAECDWDIVLRGYDADLFWEAYRGDAYAVVTK